MQTRDVIGASITNVRQTRTYNEATAQWLYVTDAIELDNGRSILFSVSEDDGGYMVDARVVRRVTTKRSK